VRTAHCAEHAHLAPQNGCSCGIYAWYSAPARTASVLTPELVSGAVALWGTIELHALGMRAEHATIVALALPFSRGPKRRRLIEAARGLEVSAVPARRLTATALEHGDLIPSWMRPPDLEPNKRKAPGPPDPARLHMAADGYRR
jgi:hypothetical protein